MIRVKTNSGWGKILVWIRPDLQQWLWLVLTIWLYCMPFGFIYVYFKLVFVVINRACWVFFKQETRFFTSQTLIWNCFFKTKRLDLTPVYLKIQPCPKLLRKSRLLFQASFNSKKTEFEKLRSDVQIKLKFLEENRVRVFVWFSPRDFRVWNYYKLTNLIIKNDTF